MATYTHGCSAPTGDGRFSIIGTKGKLTELQASALPARFKTIRATNLSASVRYVQIHDAAAAAAEGATPDLFVRKLNPGSSIEFSPSAPAAFANGIYVCSSSTADTKTITGAADMMIEVEYYPGSN
jgi:hypothetical protein